jgi:hypothetical protein
VDDINPSLAKIPAVPARVARDILESLVQDLKLRPGELVYERSLIVSFKSRGLTVQDIAAGLEYATQQGWLICDPVQGIYTLTQAGFRIA